MTIQLISPPRADKQPGNVPARANHADTLIELEQDAFFHHYIYDDTIKSWIHLGGVMSLFHPDIVAQIPTPDSLEDAYDRAMGVVG